MNRCHPLVFACELARVTSQATTILNQSHSVLLPFERISRHSYHIFRRATARGTVIYYPKCQSSSRWKGNIPIDVLLPQAGALAAYTPVAYAKGAPT